MAPDRRGDTSWRPFDWSTPQLLLAGLLIAFCLVVVVAATSSTAGFSPYNTNWDGNSEFREIAAGHGELVVTDTTDRYETVDPATTTGFVFAPDRAHDAEAIQQTRQFVAAGGTLVVADNYGPHGNELLSGVGATARFDGRILRDERNNARSPSFPTVSDISSHRLVSDVETLTLNYGTAVDPGSATPLANSSEVSYLVANDTDTLDDDTELRQYPVVTVESVGRGQVIAVGDPSLFINSMLSESDNRQFVTTLVSQRTVTLFDQSHSASLPPVVAVLLAVRSSATLAAAVVAVTIGAIAGIGHAYGRREWIPWQQWSSIQSRLLPTRFRSRSAVAVETDSLVADPEALKTMLRNRHPDWDDERIDRVIAGVLSVHTDSSDNE